MHNLMNRTLIKWKLAELMARHKVTGRDLAQRLGKNESSITRLRGAVKLPKLSGDDLEKLLLAIEQLADQETLTRPLRIEDLVEWDRETA